MKEAKLSMEVEGVPVDLILRRATIADDMRRGMLAARAMQTPHADPAEQTVAVVIYPRCLGCVLSGTVNGQPAAELSIDDFIGLPFEIGEAWLSSALDLNPSWRLTVPSAEEQTDTKKK